MINKFANTAQFRLLKLIFDKDTDRQYEGFLYIWESQEIIMDKRLLPENEGLKERSVEWIFFLSYV